MASRTASSNSTAPKAKTTATAKSSAKSPAQGSGSPSQGTTAAKAAAGASPAPAVVTEGKPVVTGVELKKKELLEEVVERSGVKKKFAKPVVEAMIDVLGEALSEGREMNLQPLGKLKQQRTKDTSNAQIIVVKIRQSKAAGPALDPADRADLVDGVKPTGISAQDKVAQAGE